jgi:DNA-binding LacI/PurR family transcriptional regulator
MKATIKDIAKALGISIATVSRALTGSYEVNKETREKVLNKAKELHYKPNIQARNLLKSKNNLIGVIIPEFRSFFFPEIIIGIQEVMNKEGYQVLICQSNESSELERKNVEMLEDSMIEGLIVSVTKESKNIDLYQRLINEMMPIVFVNRIIPELDASKVIIDDKKCAFKAVEHLIKCGYKRIAHLGGNEHLSVAKNRAQGYKDALEFYNIPLQENLIMYVGVQEDRAKIGVDYLLSLKDKPDAIFTVTDPIAVGTIIELRKRGIRVPEDIAVVGFSESPVGRALDLTSVAQPTFQIGHTAAELLLKKIKNHNTPSETIVLDAQLNIRNSSIPPQKITTKK